MILDRLTTKQFADMCKVEKRTLHYYDEIDLLKPIEIKENGYRIYSADQFDTMSMIKALQSVGMSLGEIKNLMNENDLTNSKAVLTKQIVLIREKLDELKMAEQILSQTTEQLDNYLETGCDKLFTEVTQDIYLITQDIPDAKSVSVNYITNGYHHGVIMNEKDITVPKYVFKKAPDKKENNAIKPAGTYACIYKSIPNGKIPEMIKAFIKLISSKHLITVGPLYVESIADDFIRFKNQEYVFKLSIKLGSKAIGKI